MTNTDTLRACSLSWNNPCKDNKRKNLKPMLNYCSLVWEDLSQEETEKLSEDLLKILKKYSKLFKQVGKKV